MTVKYCDFCKEPIKNDAEVKVTSTLGCRTFDACADCHREIYNAGSFGAWAKAKEAKATAQ
jgi:hypothetical protein